MRFNFGGRLADTIEIEACGYIGDGYRRDRYTCGTAHRCQEVTPAIILLFEIATLGLGGEEITWHHKLQNSLESLSELLIFLGLQRAAQLHTCKRGVECSLVKFGVVVCYSQLGEVHTAQA